ncbi:MAG: hypothetical protein ACSLEL_02740 [Candidatus Malihini olakiniferum]
MSGKISLGYPPVWVEAQKNVVILACLPDRTETDTAYSLAADAAMQVDY